MKSHSLMENSHHLSSRSARSSTWALLAGLSLLLTLGAQAAESASSSAAAQPSLISILGFAFIGGLLLNLMPCVFPVLSLKILGFAQQSGDDPKQIFRHGLVFSAGLILFVLVLASTILIAKSAFDLQLAWGFQTRIPWLLGLVVIILFALGLNLSGLFEIGTSLTSAGGQLEQKKGYLGSFFSGIFTTIVSTPCSGPFLGITMGYAAQQSPLLMLVIFFVFGLGIAAPYLILSASPGLIKKLPRPGAWMESFKKALAFPVYASVIFFIYSFMKVTGTQGGTWLLCALLVLALGLWIYGHWGTPYRKKTTKYLAWLTALALTGGATALNFYAAKFRENTALTAPAAAGEFAFKPWTPTSVADNQKAGKITFVDFTAPG
jgi:thiol:disulfide interchange protein